MFTGVFWKRGRFSPMCFGNVVVQGNPTGALSPTNVNISVVLDGFTVGPWKVVFGYFLEGTLYFQSFSRKVR